MLDEARFSGHSAPCDLKEREVVGRVSETATAPSDRQGIAAGDLGRGARVLDRYRFA